MNTQANNAFEAFLVEDVILTLGTVRGALGWIGDSEGCPPSARAEGLARIARQIAALEDRARDLWRDLREAPRPMPQPSVDVTDNVFDLGAMPVVAAPRAIFRSRRPGP